MFRFKTRASWEKFVEWCFHGGQKGNTHLDEHGNPRGDFYKQPPEKHSLGGRGGKRDSNGNLLGQDGLPIGRHAAFYGGGGGGGSGPSWVFPRGRNKPWLG